MTQLQFTLNPFSGSEKENFREFELLLRNFLKVAALAANQQAKFFKIASPRCCLTTFSNFAYGNTSKIGTFNISSSRSVL